MTDKDYSLNKQANRDVLLSRDSVRTQNTRDATVAVIMLTINQREKTLRALASFRAVTNPWFKLFLWDNGSQDGTADAVRDAFPEVVVHYHPTNLGAAGGRNAAAKLAIDMLDPSHLLFIDNDMTVSPNCLMALLAPFEDDILLAQTTGRIRALTDEKRLNDAGGCKIQFWLGRTKPIGNGEVDRGQYDKVTRCIPGGFTMVRTDVFQKVGGFDQTFDPYGYEDLDFSLRIRNSGYYALYIPEALAFHEVTQTFENGNYTERYARQKAKNWLLFMRRHANVIEQLGFFCVGAPYGLARAIIRETKKGNLRALKGLLHGLNDCMKSAARSKV